METRANYIAVGIFTVVAILAAFGFVYWTARIGSSGDTALLRFRIAGSAAGLGRGSAVLFNGVKIGDVKRVYIDPTNSKNAVADAQVNRDTPVTTASEANVGIAGLTGQANIEISGAGNKPGETGPGAPENVFEKAEKAGGVAEIKTNPSAVTNLLESAQDIFKRTDSVLTGLEGFVKDVRPPLTQTVKNAEVFSEALKKNAGGIDDFLASAGKLADTLKGVSGKLGGTLDSAKGLLDSVDKTKVADIVGNVDTFTDRLKSASNQVDGIMKNVDSTVTSVHDLSASAKGTLTKLDGTISKVDGVVAAVDPESVRTTMANINQASGTARAAIADVSKVAVKIGNHADDVDQIVQNAKELTQRLNDASVRVNGVLAKVDKLLGSGDANGLARQATDTLKSIKQVADTLNARIGPITDGLARFSGQGLRNVDDLIQESRQAVTRIEQAVDNLARNPSSILTGGQSGSVPRYDGRNRR